MKGPSIYRFKVSVTIHKDNGEVIQCFYPVTGQDYYGSSNVESARDECLKQIISNGLLALGRGEYIPVCKISKIDARAELLTEDAYFKLFPLF